MLLTPYLDDYDGLSDRTWRTYNPGRQIGIFRHRFITHDYLTLALLMEGFYEETLVQRNAAIEEAVKKGIVVEVTRAEKIRCKLPVGFSLYRIPHAKPVEIAGDEITLVNYCIGKFYSCAYKGLTCGSLVPMDLLIAKIKLDDVPKQGALEYLIQRGDLLEAPSEFLREQRLYGRHLYSPAHHHLIYN